MVRRRLSASTNDMALSETPPPEWAQAFAHPSNVPISLSMHPPELSGSTVRIRPPDEEFGPYVDHVEMRIIAANNYYEEHVLRRACMTCSRPVSGSTKTTSNKSSNRQPKYFTICCWSFGRSADAMDRAVGGQT